MTSNVLPNHLQRCLTCSRGSAWAVLAVAMLVLTGWALDIPTLTSAIPGHIAMNPVTAITFIVGGLALLELHRRDVAQSHALVRILAVLVMALPLLALSRLFLPWDLGPDRLLFAAKVAVPLDGFPNRMAPMTGITFQLVGITLLMLTFPSARLRQIPAALATIVGLIALIVVVDYGFQSQSLSSVGGLIPVSFPTAVAFLILAIGILSARPENGVMSLVVSKRMSGELARRLLPAALLIPVTIGWFEIQGEGNGWFNHASGDAIVVISTTVILTALIALSVIAIDRSDDARTRAEAELRDFNQNLEARVANRTRELEAINQELNAEIHARVRVEEELHHTADELRGLFEASPLATCSLSPTNEVLSWNHAAESLFGWTAAEAVGHQLPIINAALTSESQHLTAKVMAGTPLLNFETKRMRKDGTLVDVTISTAALFDADGKARGIFAVYTDISARKLLESQLRQAQKLEAIGRLAGGVAHDFNNILTVVHAAGEFLLADLETDDARRADANEIVHAAQRGANLTRQLLAFSRQQVLDLQVVNLNDVVRPLEPMLRRLLEANINFGLNLRSDIDLIKADSNQLEQVMMNLVVNARDAMPSGGSILVETANVTLDEAYPRDHLSARPGPHVMLSVTDTGVGMDVETQARIFEPFFTTKATGKGTGLGLATVYGIVKQLGGHIWVYSEVGRGSAFKVYFPSTVDALPAPSGLADVTPGAVTAGARILLVEDDSLVRLAVKRLLERSQYRVTDVASAQEGLDWMAANDHAVDLVLSDMMMPGMTGLELRAHIRASEHPIPVLLMSGYSEEAITRLGNQETLAPHIEKPFTLNKILPKIEELIAPTH